MSSHSMARVMWLLVFDPKRKNPFQRFCKDVWGKTKVKNGFTKMLEAKQKWKTVLQKCWRQNKSEKRFYKNVGGKTKVKNSFTKMSEAKQKWKTVLQKCRRQNKSEKRFYKNVGGKTKVKNGFVK